MAPVLVCPECSTKHPLDSIGARSAFPCSGCGRTLKVPALADASTRAPAFPPSPEPVAAEPVATQVLSAPVPRGAPPVVVTPPPVAADEPARVAPARDPIPPRWARFVLWIVAIPLAFFVVFALARILGMLTTNEITDVALAEGWRRFVPIARLIPFVAVASALFVHGGAYGIARVRSRRWALQAGGARSGAPRTNGQASRTGQSSRTGA